MTLFTDPRVYTGLTGNAKTGGSSLYEGPTGWIVPCSSPRTDENLCQGQEKGQGIH